MDYTSKIVIVRQVFVVEEAVQDYSCLPLLVLWHHVSRTLH